MMMMLSFAFAFAQETEGDKRERDAQMEAAAAAMTLRSWKGENGAVAGAAAVLKVRSPPHSPLPSLLPSHGLPFFCC